MHSKAPWHKKAPWYASILIAALHALSVQCPDWHATFQEVVNVLTFLWFGHMATAVHEIRNGGT